MKNEEQKLGRQTSLELLRIISMLMIVAGHSVIHGGFEEFPLSVNGALAIALTQGSRIGVDIFVILTGYFSVEKEVSIKKVKTQYFQIWTYSVLITALMLVMGEKQINVKLAVGALMPVSTSQYWFATCYILLLLLSPCLQICIERINKQQFQRVLIVFGVLWSVIPTFLIGTPGYNNFTWFIYVYMLAAYFRKYGSDLTGKIRIWHGALWLLIICAGAILTYVIGYTIPFFKSNAIYLFADMNKLPAIICALLLFFGFRNWNIKTNEKINKIASCTFGVYLLHDNPNIRETLWCKLLKNANFITSNGFVLRISLSIITVFIVGIAIEWIRQYMVKEIKHVCVKSKKQD
ncbi:MAG: acyltransferase [Acutalibacteraceae bacterium]